MRGLRAARAGIFSIMIYLQTESLTKSYGTRMLFADISFAVNQGDKIGIVAPNGTGKSTFLRVLAGLESPDSGTATYRTDICVGFLPQHPQFGEGVTPRTGAPEIKDADARQLYIRLLGQFGLTDFLDSDMAHLSGGQRKRVALARTLAPQPDMLFLDEPTNHLDIPTIEWLENYLRRSTVTLLLVTHDRYFLDRVCNNILEIHQTAAYMHPGNYDAYLRRRDERFEAQQAQQARDRNTLRREQEWINRQPQARGGKQQARIDRFNELKQSVRNAPQAAKELNLQNSKNTYIGNKIFHAHHISKAFGDHVILRDFDYVFARHDRVGIVGANGVGKTTLIRMLMGLEQPDSGNFEVGTTVRFGYYSQDGMNFDPGQKVIDAVSAIADWVPAPDGGHISASQFLARFLFPVPDQQKFISKLSGGELCRLHLATVLMRQPNFLVLDEPTNDLDLPTLEVLGQYLEGFGGCLLVISHDRHFLDTVTNHLFVMEGNGTMRDFPGTYSQYRASLAAAAPEEPREAAPRGKKEKTQAPPRLTFKEKRELETLTAEIETLTAEKDQLEALFNSGEAIADIADRARRYEEVKDILDQKELRWLELSEKECTDH